MRNPRVAIVTAVDSELAALRQLIDLHDETDPADGSVYLRGTLENPACRDKCAPAWEVILPMPSSAGNVFSAITADRVAAAMKPDVIMFIGCAGGIPGKINLYDVVVADKVFYYEPAKVDEQLFPRPDIGRPTQRLLERAHAELHSERWHQFLAPHLSNEPPAVWIQPIAAGELLIKRSDSAHMEHVKNVAPRSIAVEQEGYGVLMAAHLRGLHAIVVRGISDLLDDKGSDPGEDLAMFNPRQIKATRHAAAFALCLLCNLDVSIIPGVRHMGSTERTVVTITLSGDTSDYSDIKLQLIRWLEEGKLGDVRFSRGSIKVQFSVDPGHALLLNAAFDAGLIKEIAGYPIEHMEAAGGTPPTLATELANRISSLDLASPSAALQIEGLRAAGSSADGYIAVMGEIVSAASAVLASRAAIPRRVEKPFSQFDDSRENRARGNAQPKPRLGDRGYNRRPQSVMSLLVEGGGSSEWFLANRRQARFFVLNLEKVLSDLNVNYTGQMEYFRFAEREIAESTDWPREVRFDYRSSHTQIRPEKRYAPKLFGHAATIIVAMEIAARDAAPDYNVYDYLRILPATFFLEGLNRASLARLSEQFERSPLPLRDDRHRGAISSTGFERWALEMIDQPYSDRLIMQMAAGHTVTSWVCDRLRNIVDEYFPPELRLGRTVEVGDPDSIEGDGLRFKGAAPALRVPRHRDPDDLPACG